MVSSACEGSSSPDSGIPPEMLHHYTSGDHDEDLTDADSAYGDDSLIGDDTKTLSTYITDYRYEFGRRYHSYRDGAYWGPNDEVANEQQDIAHHMYFLTLDGKLHLAPISNPQEILDVGTGTGIWAIDTADEYPSACVTGVDLSPIQPPFVPPNCVFEIDDITLSWTYPPNSFDFIHVRELFGCIPDWDKFFRECWHCLKPGGYIEVVEHSVQPIADDATMGPNHFYNEWGRVVVESGERFGKTFKIWEESASRLKKAGFVDVIEKQYKWPMNGWSPDPKLHELGRWNQFRLHGGIEGFMLRLLTTTLGWSYESAQVHLAQMRAALHDYRTHAYLPGTVVYAQKPRIPTPLRDI
ncbi:S-adenosyl-L-methionine-dependent methyltransferase [Aspergillus cavernicola]|uniref:S-adenosyl-L-methionine-dependent methyltransferase n=1 Tax=Aspergillus cavernicola TaxID=176166 RepID=A0ABR4IBW8_9EURO